MILDKTYEGKQQGAKKEKRGLGEPPLGHITRKGFPGEIVVKLEE